MNLSATPFTHFWKYLFGLIMSSNFHALVLNWNPTEECSAHFDVHMAYGQKHFVHPSIRKWQDEFKLILHEAHREKSGHGFGWCYVNEIPEKIQERNIELSRLDHELTEHKSKKERMSMEMNRKCKSMKSAMVCSCKSCTVVFDELYQADVKILVIDKIMRVIQDIVGLLEDIYNKPSVGVAF